MEIVRVVEKIGLERLRREPEIREGTEPGTSEGGEPGIREGTEPGTPEGTEPGIREGTEPG